MDLGLKGRIVLVTGGSKGIGLAAARAFAAEGARVAVCSRSADNVDMAAATLPGAQGFYADLTDARAASGMIEAVERDMGPVDVLVNSAGAARRCAPNDLTPDVWRDAMDTKFFTTINATDPMIKRMARRGRGVIVTVIGIGGKVAAPVHIAGGAANSALMLATAGLATAYAAQGVRVVGVSPGMTETGRVAGRLETEARLAGIPLEEARRRAIGRIPIGRMASPEEIADTILFLASPRASYVTGVTVAMDGALHPVVL
ncbi:MAG: SDR family oxidoreductase [Telmatospirillum sp.]|nr:SDR family oxidoreductase [Telmatospirillum sp.]